MQINPQFAERLSLQIARLEARNAVSVRYQFTGPGGVYYVRRTLKGGIMAEAEKASRIASKRAEGAVVLCGVE